MPTRQCATVLLISLAAAAPAAAQEGIVLEVTQDLITIQQGSVRTLTFPVSNELLTNTLPKYDSTAFSVKFREVKKGYKVRLFLGGPVEGRVVCSGVELRNPGDAGVVTEVGKDTVTILNDNGTTTTYRVVKDLVDNSRDPDRYSVLYPSRFSEVTLGCRIEVSCYKQDGEMVICELDVKKAKDKDK